MGDALALLELDGVAVGLRALDALVKRAPVEVIEANLVEPGRYLILLTGGVAEVDESLSAVVEDYAQQVVAKMVLPRAHPALVAGLGGAEDRSAPDFVVHGKQSDVEAALTSAEEVLQGRERLHRVELIPRPHREMVAWLLRTAPFQVG
jgi:microcompartment protein CcmL/EutN